MRGVYEGLGRWDNVPLIFICYYLILFVFCLLESREGSSRRSKHQLYLTSTANRGEQKDCNKNIGVLRAFYNNNNNNNNNNNDDNVDDNDSNDNDYINDSDSENDNNDSKSLSPKGDQHPFSPNNIRRSTRVQVMRIT